MESNELVLTGAITGVVALLILVIRSLAFPWIMKAVEKAGLEIDAEQRVFLAETFGAGLALVKREVLEAIPEVAVTIKNDAVRRVGAYVLGHAPDAARHLGLTEDRIEDWVKARFTPADMAVIEDFAAADPGDRHGGRPASRDQS